MPISAPGKSRTLTGTPIFPDPLPPRHLLRFRRSLNAAPPRPRTLLVYVAAYNISAVTGRLWSARSGSPTTCHASPSPRELIQTSNQDRAIASSTVAAASAKAPRQRAQSVWTTSSAGVLNQEDDSRASSLHLRRTIDLLSVTLTELRPRPPLRPTHGVRGARHRPINLGPRASASSALLSRAHVLSAGRPAAADAQAAEILCV